MARAIAALIFGVLLGIIAMLAAPRLGPASNQSPQEIIRDIVDVPTMAQSDAVKHRDEHYANLTSIEEIIALPTEFARSEALYALAGRSDSAAVQNLIFEANRIANQVERTGLLKILFYRLAETDPRSALALARIDPAKGIRSIEELVWRAWARKDLEDALFAAKTQTSMAKQNSAAQSLYAAFGYMGNENTDHIESELGIGPDRLTRSRFLYQLADRSPAEAIDFINSLERRNEQQEYVSWLASYVFLGDPTAALGYANLFRVAADGASYSNIINAMIARENPQATIDSMLASGRSMRASGEYRSAIRALVSTDLDAAKRYFEQARSTEDRQVFGSIIAMELAGRDPVEALAWARANDEIGPYSNLQVIVLSQIAQTDPQLALTEALKSPNTQLRENMVSVVVQGIARNNPAEAVAYLDQIPNQQQKREAREQLASSWINQDPDTAMEWILSQDKQSSGQMLRQAGFNLLHRDIDAAIRILPRMDEQDQVSMRQQIAQNLAANRSPSEAQSFIRQFEGQPGYKQLQASMISGVAQTDVVMAKQLADQLADGNARDAAYIQIIAQHARTDPTDAARWLSSVNNDDMRDTAAGQIASQWYQYDPAAATHWVLKLQAGSARDTAIMQMSARWRDPTAEQYELIASIEDRDKRGQAKIRQIYNLMRTNPAEARRLLEDEDIPSKMRQQAETMISQNRLGF